MPRIKLILEYDGTPFAGWQWQDNARSIQGELEKALKTVLRREMRVTASGRTDAGVHARNQVAHCDIEEKTDLFRVQSSLNALLPDEIAVKDISYCADDFNARFDAKKRLYRYYITKTPTALNKRFSWYLNYSFNYTLMQDGAEIIASATDFKSFCKTGSNNTHYRCVIFNAGWRKDARTGMWFFEIKANRFLYGMVRALVGTLVELGRGRIGIDDLKYLIEARDRTKVPFTAPARGLFLEEITY